MLKKQLDTMCFFMMAGNENFLDLDDTEIVFQ